VFLGLYWGSSGGFFFVLGEKMGPNLKIFEKSQKCRGKKKKIFSEPVLLDTSSAHQFGCNTFFRKIFFFKGESWKTFFLLPRRPWLPPVICPTAKRFVFDGSDVHFR
jgi:hypothetical protein